MALAEVHTLYDTNCRIIPEMHRGTADLIEGEDPEKESPTVAMVAIQLLADGTPIVYGWGDTNIIHAMGVLHLALQDIGSIQLSTDD